MAQVNALAEEMTKAQADWQIMSYGGTVHSCTNPEADRVGVPGIVYNTLADERSWKGWWHSSRKFSAGRNPSIGFSCSNGS